MIVRAGASTADIVFKNRLDIWSGPLPLCGLSLSRSARTPSTATVMSEAAGMGVTPPGQGLMTGFPE